MGAEIAITLFLFIAVASILSYAFIFQVGWKGRVKYKRYFFCFKIIIRLMTSLKEGVLPTELFGNRWMCIAAASLLQHSSLLLYQRPSVSFPISRILKAVRK